MTFKMCISWSSISTSPIPCTEWGGRPFSTQVRLRFGPGLHTDEKTHTIQELFYWARRLIMSSSISKGSTIDAYRRKGCPFLSNKIWRESYCASRLDRSCKVFSLIEMMSLLHTIWKESSYNSFAVCFYLPSPSSNGRLLETWESREGGWRPRRKSGSGRDTGSAKMFWSSAPQRKIFSKDSPKPTGKGEF